jgi:hypothetical protein
MDDVSVEKLIVNGQITREAMQHIEKKEYSFVKKYIKSTDLDIREDVLTFLHYINQPWCYKWYLVALDDPQSRVRSFAGEGILSLKNVGKVDEIYAGIEKEKRISAPEDYAAIPVLIKVIGNIGSKNDVEKLKKEIAGLQTDDLVARDIHSAALAALTKLGDVEVNKDIEKTLTMGTAVERMNALDIIAYTENKAWVPKVAPLLEDQSVAMSFEIGPTRVNKRVCDFTVNTLIAIDSEKKIPLQPLGAFPYQEQDIQMVKKMYGVNDDNTNE